MPSKYYKGSKVIVAPVEEQSLSRDARLAPYTGRTGVITECYSMQRDREVFYLYTVRMENEPMRKIVLHEDELQPSLN
jgi:hypothetical protein